MSRQVRITAGKVELTAELDESNTAEAIWNALPLAGRANLWGEEIYFTIPLDLEAEDGRETVERGDLCYWPAGSAFCIFFGPTPASYGDEIRPASAVNVFGKIRGDVTLLERVAAGSAVKIEKAV